MDTIKAKIICCSFGLFFVLIAAVMRLVDYTLGMCLASLCMAACMGFDCLNYYHKQKWSKFILCAIGIALIIIGVIVILVSGL